MTSHGTKCSMPKQSIQYIKFRVQEDISLTLSPGSQMMIYFSLRQRWQRLVALVYGLLLCKIFHVIECSVLQYRTFNHMGYFVVVLIDGEHGQTSNPKQQVKIVLWFCGAISFFHLMFLLNSN